MKKSEVLLIIIGLLTAAVLGVILSMAFYNSQQYPNPPTIITVPSIPDTTRTEINKEIDDEVFQRALKQFEICMTDGKGTSTEECRRRFYAHE